MRRCNRWRCSVCILSVTVRLRRPRGNRREKPATVIVLAAAGFIVMFPSVPVTLAAVVSATLIDCVPAVFSGAESMFPGTAAVNV